MTVLASGIILYRAGTLQQDPKLLLLRHASTGHWGFPKGRRDPGDEHEVATAEREVQEETGYSGLQLHPSFRATIEYVVRRRRDAGQSKRVVYFLAEAPPGDPRLSAEHDAFVWADARELAGRLVFAQMRDLAHHALACIPRPAAPRG